MATKKTTGRAKPNIAKNAYTKTKKKNMSAEEN